MTTINVKVMFDAFYANGTGILFWLLLYGHIHTHMYGTHAHAHTRTSAHTHYAHTHYAHTYTLCTHIHTFTHTHATHIHSPSSMLWPLSGKTVFDLQVVDVVPLFLPRTEAAFSALFFAFTWAFSSLAMRLSSFNWSSSFFFFSFSSLFLPLPLRNQCWSELVQLLSLQLLVSVLILVMGILKLHSEPC